jgi:hypothetical protein
MSGIRVQNMGDAVQAGGAATWDQSPEYGRCSPGRLSWYLGSESRIRVKKSMPVGLVPGIRVQNTGYAVQAGWAGTWDQSPEYG